MPILRCSCGQVEAKITGEPFGMINCYCHSCTACARFVDEKNTSDKTSGTSGLTSDGNGNAIVFYKPDQLGAFTFKEEGSAENLIGALQLGDKGSAHRFYAKCCNTYLTGTHSTYLCLNPNALYIEDDNNNTTKLYDPTLSPAVVASTVPNVMRKFAFDPSTVPEPAFNIFPMTVASLKNVSAFLNVFAPKLKPESGLVVLKSDDGSSNMTIEVVPITWK